MGMCISLYIIFLLIPEEPCQDFRHVAISKHRSNLKRKTHRRLDVSQRYNSKKPQTVALRKAILGDTVSLCEVFFSHYLKSGWWKQTLSASKAFLVVLEAQWLGRTKCLLGKLKIGWMASLLKAQHLTGGMQWVEGEEAGLALSGGVKARGQSNSRPPAAWRAACGGDQVKLYMVEAQSVKTDPQTHG